MPALATVTPLVPEPTATLRAELARLRACADALARVAGRPVLDDVVDADHAVRTANALGEALARHFARVDRLVAPRVLRALPDTVALLDLLAQEHRAVNACVGALQPHLRALAAGRVVSGVTFGMAVGFVLDALRPRLAREESALHPLVDALPEEERRAMAAALAPWG